MENEAVSSNASVLSSTTLLATPSKQNKTDTNKGTVFSKIPVVISETDVQIYVDAAIQMEEPVLEITNVKNKVYLTRNEFMLTDDRKSSKMLIGGFVIKNIEYSTVKKAGNVSICGEKHFTILNIPFICFAKVDFAVEPATSSINSGSKGTAPIGLWSDQFGTNSTSSEVFNEKIYCELIQANVRDSRISRNITGLTNNAGGCANEATFSSFQDIMVVELTMRVLQNQTLPISPDSLSGSQQGNGGKSGEGNSQGKENSGDSKSENKGNGGKSGGGNSRGKENSDDSKSENKENGRDDKGKNERGNRDTRGKSDESDADESTKGKSTKILLEIIIIDSENEEAKKNSETEDRGKNEHESKDKKESDGKGKREEKDSKASDEKNTGNNTKTKVEVRIVNNENVDEKDQKP